MSRDWERDTLTMVGRAPAGAEAQRLTALAVCDRAGRGLDVEDPVQRREAAALARPFLDALGLLGDERAPAHINTARFAHGSQAGVDWHVERGHASLCAACQRFVEVRENRAERCAGGGCDSVNAYWSHRNAQEPTCAASRAAYRVYQREQAAKGPAAR